MQHKLLALLLCMATLFSLAACGKGPGKPDAQPSAEAPQTTQATAPPVTIPADGNADDVTCRGSYTVSDDEISAAANTVVATMEGGNLTNSQLQIYYWLEVAAYRQANEEVEPDFSRPLDTQSCPLDDGVNSWQQYFLRKALDTWHAHQALENMSQEEGVPTEAEYKPDLEKHAEYMTGKPATKYLYGNNPNYVPNSMHQEYLDSVPAALRALAKDNGFTTSGAQAKAIAGTGAGVRDIISYTHLSNFAYMYFTEMGYHFEPTAEEIEAYYQENMASEARPEGKTVDLRHILLIPDNAEVAADGTVTADEDDWERCLMEAKGIVDKWKKRVNNTRFAQHAVVDPAESRFSEFAKDYSEDPGSSSNGGLYVDVAPGQLMPELDAWCFDAARQHGDYEILRTDAGCHIVFLSSVNENWFTEAESRLLQQMYADLVSGAMEKYPMEVAYSDIRLGQAEDNGSFITPSDLLYPDVAHERFPDMPLYLQQDYPDAPYGDYKLSTHGCGITTLAMVASYMADDELTPVELAARYGYYCGVRGTEIVLFDDTPAEMGFHLQNRSFSWAEMDEALRNGQVVISLQWVGYWTSGGHYLAMIDLTEDGRYVVRDSNLINYKRITAHEQDSHSRGSISQAGQYYWIYEKKVTSIPTCVRCGGDTEGAPQIMFREDYHCAKCLTAMERRDNFLQIA